MTHPHEWLARPGGLAEQLLDLRKAADMAGKDLAAVAGWAPSKVSRLEHGRQMPSRADILEWVRVTRGGDGQRDTLLALLGELRDVHQDWRRKMANGQVAVQVDHNALTATASVIRYFETLWVPGFLQTREYATTVLTHMRDLHDLEVDDIDRAVTLRLQRRAALYDIDKRFDLLIAEPVLGWLFCPPEVMRQQLLGLQVAFELGNVRFGILPTGRPIRTPPQNAFQMYDDLVVVETFTEERQFGDETVDRYARIMDRLWGDAVEGEQARDLIGHAAALLG